MHDTDLVIRGGMLLDGTGAAPRRCDIAVRGDRVVDIGVRLPKASTEVDADGLYVSPGFIDAHSHSDAVPLLDEAQPFKLLQGVTTEIVGNCGFSYGGMTEAAAAHAADAWSELLGGMAPVAGSFSDYLSLAARRGPTNNVAALLGYGTLRLSANGLERSLPPSALAQMLADTEQAMAAGAFGISTGLVYAPNAYADKEEMAQVVSVAGRFGRVYASHIRSESDGLEAALDEAFAVAEMAGARFQLSHCKAMGRANHGKGKALLEALTAARARGLDAFGDAYPYTAGLTWLFTLLPPSSGEGGADQLRARLGDPTRRAALRDETLAGTTGGYWSAVEPPEALLVAHRRPELVGRRLGEIAGGRDLFDTACDLLLEDMSALMICEAMSEDDVRVILSDPLIGIGSDNALPQGLQHPRTWGTFPRFLGEYVRELGLVSWAEAVRKMTSSTARHFGLVGRGTLEPGAIADITLFDPTTIGHHGDYTSPAVAPVGVHTVLLAGEVVVTDGAFQGVRRGRVLRAGLPDLESAA